METITIRVERDTLKSLDAEASERDKSRSEHIRDILRTRNEAERLRSEYEQRLDELREERDSAEAHANDLRRQLQAANRQRENVDELVEYVEEERTLRERREDRRSAPVWRRAKWWVFGRD